MSEKPILFNTKMVQAIRERRKTQTRRIIKLAPGFSGRQVGESGNPDNPLGFMYPCGIKRPPCNKGDILWVRETWAHPSEAEVRNGANSDAFIYKADAPLLPAAPGRWHPSIHMPKEAARIFLRVKDVQAERLQDITQQQAVAEGFPSRTCGALGLKFKDGENAEHDQHGIELCVVDFAQLWDSTIKPADHERYGWNANPWVWVIEFEPCEKPEGWPQCR